MHYKMHKKGQKKIKRTEQQRRANQKHEAAAELHTHHSRGYKDNVQKSYEECPCNMTARTPDSEQFRYCRVFKCYRIGLILNVLHISGTLIELNKTAPSGSLSQLFLFLNPTKYMNSTFFFRCNKPISKPEIFVQIGFFQIAHQISTIAAYSMTKGNELTCIIEGKRGKEP